jgi:hypothetical protein
MVTVALTKGAHVKTGAVNVGQDRAGALVQQTPGLRWRHTARMAQQQRQAKLFLQQPDLRAKGGLRQPKPLRGRRHAASVHDLEKIGELAKID